MRDLPKTPLVAPDSPEKELALAAFFETQAPQSEFTQTEALLLEEHTSLLQQLESICVDLFKTKAFQNTMHYRPCINALKAFNNKPFESEFLERLKSLLMLGWHNVPGKPIEIFKKNHLQELINIIKKLHNILIELKKYKNRQEACAQPSAKAAPSETSLTQCLTPPVGLLGPQSIAPQQFAAASLEIAQNPTPIKQTKSKGRRIISQGTPLTTSGLAPNHRPYIGTRRALFQNAPAKTSKTLSESQRSVPHEHLLPALTILNKWLKLAGQNPSFIEISDFLHQHKGKALRPQSGKRAHENLAILINTIEQIKIYIKRNYPVKTELSDKNGSIQVNIHPNQDALDAIGELAAYQNTIRNRM